jgi:SprT protein
MTPPALPMTPPTLLLTPALREQVNNAIEAAYAKAEKHYDQKFQRPEVRYNIRNTNGGEAHISKNLIRFNLTFLVENTEHFLKTTVPHEVAHHVAHAVYDKKPMNGKKVRPHGAEWCEVMGLFGLVPPKEFKKHNYDVTSLDLVRRPRKSRKKSIEQKVEELLHRAKKLGDEGMVLLQIRLDEERNA